MSLATVYSLSELPSASSPTSSSPHATSLTEMLPAQPMFPRVAHGTPEAVSLASVYPSMPPPSNATKALMGPRWAYPHGVETKQTFPEIIPDSVGPFQMTTKAPPPRVLRTRLCEDTWEESTPQRHAHPSCPRQLSCTREACQQVTGKATEVDKASTTAYHLLALEQSLLSRH